MTELAIRAMQREDLAEVFALQCRAYPPEYHEPVMALASRLEAGGPLCLVAHQGVALAGYLFAHPWHGDVPRLHAPLARPGSQAADHIFLHDMAIAPECRGLACGRRLHDALLARCAGRGVAQLRLVAVGEAAAFWQRLGFRRATRASLPGSYGDACLMERATFEPA